MTLTSPEKLHEKLTNTELFSLENMDEEYMAAFMSYNCRKMKRQIDLEKLKLSESKSRYKESICIRDTVFLEKSALLNSH